MADKQDEKVIPKIADAAQAIGAASVAPARQTPEVAAPVPSTDPLPEAAPLTPVAASPTLGPVPQGEAAAEPERKEERRRVAERLLDLPGIPARDRAVDERSVTSAAVTGFAAGFGRGLVTAAPGSGGAQASTDPSIQDARAHEAHVAGMVAGEEQGLPYLTPTEQADVARRIMRSRDPQIEKTPGVDHEHLAPASTLSANEQEVLAELRRPGADRTTQEEVLAELPDRVVHETSVQIEQQEDQAHQVQDAIEEARTRQGQFYARHPELAPAGQEQLPSEVLQRHPELNPDPVGPEPHDPDYVRQVGTR